MIPMKLGNSFGVMIEDWDDAEIGKFYRVDGDEYVVVDKQSLSKYTDGKYSGRPAWIQLRGFHPNNS